MSEKSETKFYPALTGWANRRGSSTPMSRTRFVRRCAAGLAIALGVALGMFGGMQQRPAAAAPAAPTRNVSRPNIVVIVADDLGYGDLSAYGGDIKTPNIDAIGASGVRYTSGYATAPVCSPSRAGLLSGRFQGRFGLYYLLVNRAGPTGMPGSETTIAEVAKKANYRTAIVGKWHVGSGAGLHPLDQGFDSFFGFLDGATSYFPDGTKGLVTANTGEDKLVTRARFPIMRDRTIVDPPGNLTDAFTDEAVRFIDTNRKQPFFLYLAYNAPHMPLEATEEEVKPFADTPSTYSRVYKAMVTKLDQGVGRVMNELRALGLDRNTLVVFVSDNGCPNYDRGACSNAPLSGWKAFPLEGGDRIPFMLSWPGRVKSGQVAAQPISTLDIMPTIAAALGQRAPAGAEGRNLLPTGSSPDNRLFYWRMGPNYWVRQGPWKLIVINKTDSVQTLDDVLGKPIPDGTKFGVSPLGQWKMLFNLDSDPKELTDVSAAHPEIVARLDRRYEQWNRKNIDPAFTSRRVFRTEINGKKVQLIF